MLVKPMNNYNDTPQITGSREPRPAKEGISSDTKEQGRGASAIMIISLLRRRQHLEGFGQGTAAQGVFLLLNPPAPAAEGLGLGLPVGGGEAARAAEEEEEPNEGGVEEN